MTNGNMWRDSDGNSIQAHGGFMLAHEGVYYWYGEVKDGATDIHDGTKMAYAQNGGIAVYNSTDLSLWHFCGLALSVSTDPAASGDLKASRVLERPRVLYNASRGVFTMWLHVDSANYWDARVGVAVSRSPGGPFQYRGSFRPNGQESRDFTVFKDDDGAAYLFYSSEVNANLHVTRMTNDYLSLESSFTLLPEFKGQYREAPIVWRHKGVYYLWTSGCTGWKANKARLHVADSVEGPWMLWGYPSCSPAYSGGSQEADSQLRSPSKKYCLTTFQSQGTALIPYPAASPTGAGYLWMADRWREDDLPMSGYVWLRLTVVDSSQSGGNVTDRAQDIRVEVSWASHFSAALPSGALQAETR